MRKLLLLGCAGLMCLALPLSINAQTYDWAMNVGGVGATGNDQANCVVVDASNNIYTGGYAASNPASAVNFNPLGTSTTVNITTGTDAYIAKYNSTGVLQKAFKWVATLDDKVNGICTDASGNVFATGYGKGTINLDPAFSKPSETAGSAGGIIIAKYNPALSTVVWGHAITDAATGSTGNAGYGIVTGSDGSVYVTGSFAGSVDFDTSAATTILASTGTGDLDMFVAKYTNAGVLVWAFRVGSTSSDIGYGIAIDASDNIYVTGKFSGVNVDFDPGAGTNNVSEYGNVVGSGDGFVAKYNSSGVHQWAFSFGGPLADLGRSIAVSSSGTVFVTGSFQGTSAPLADFDPVGTSELTSAGLADMFVAGYTSSGTFIWAKRAGGANDDLGMNVSADASGQAYATGYIGGSGAINFGAESITIVGGKDAFFAKYNAADGTNLFAKGICGANDDIGGGIAVDGTSSIIAVGSFNGTSVDFNPGAGTNALTTNGGSDIYNARYTQCSAPIISTQPTAQNICPGSPATFTVVASGGTLSYQWKLGATNVGTNSPTLTISSPGAGDVGSYTVVVTNTCPASVTSTAVNLTLKTTTAISTQPTFSGPVCTGSTLTLSTVATGTNLSYQWKQGSTNVGTSSATYTKASATTADNGSYTVVVTGDCGTVTSSAAAVTIGATTAITTHPNFTGPLCTGGTLSLNVVATGSNLTYQWKQGSTNVGTSSATYTKGSATTGDNGSYTVVVTGDCGTVTSNATAVTVGSTTAITTQPTFSGPLCAGGTLSLSVVATGTNLSYQWKQGATNVGTNSASYSKPSATTADNGSYTVVVTGDCGTVTSNVAAVTVGATTAITTQPNFVGPLCQGATLTLNVVASGSNLSYQWKQGGSNVGTSSATYTKASATTGDNGIYTVVVTGDCGTVTSSGTTVTVSTPPSISTQPTAQNVCPGSPASFSVVATGSGTLTYQWKLGSTNVGTNTPTYSIASAGAGDVGSYTVVVSNGCAPNATSSAVALTLKTATAISTQPTFTGPVCQGSALNLSVVATGTNLSYQWKQGSTNVGSNAATYTQASSTTADNGSYTVVVTGDCGTVTSSAAVVTISTPPGITTQPTAQNVCAGSAASFTVVASGSGTMAYQWKLGSTNVGTNSATLNIASAAAGDVGSYTVVVSNGCAPNATSSAAALTLKTATSITTQPSFSGPVCPGNALTLSVVAAGNGTLSYQWKQGSTNVGTNAATYTKASSSSADDGSYTVVVTGDCGSVISSATTVSISTVPAITTQPSDQSICSASPASFTVAATGTGLSYQWKKGSTNVGTNSATYTIASPVPGDAGSYSVVVTGTCAPSVTSNTVTLAVGTTTAISTQPSFTGPLCQGSTLSLSVVATGTNLSYQWKQGSTNVGTSSATYTKASSTAGDNGSYTVVVTGDCGTVTSSAAAVTVSTPPAITTQPTDESICSASPVSFTVVATGSGLSYQWKKGSTNVGTNSATYTIASPVAGDAGSYSVVVSGTCTPSVTSNTVALAVGTTTAITTQPSFTGPLCQGSALSLSVVAVGSNLSYQWKQGSTNVGTSAATYTQASSTTADNGSYTVVVTGDCGTVTSSAAVVTVSTPPSITTQPVAQNACPSTSATFTVVATGTGLSYQWVKAGTTNVGTNSATFTIPSVVAGDAANYTVVVSGSCTPAVTSNPVALTVGGSPVINTQPVSQSICVGSATTFSVVASGTSLTYQWKKGGVDIGPATSSTYTIPSTVVGDAGSYTVSVTSGCGSTLSSAAILTVKTLPSITTQPTAQTVCDGSALNISVLGSGSSLTYQWRLDGADIFGATFSTYTVAAASAPDAGSYSVLLSNGCAPDVLSNAVAVTINSLPAITVQPVDASVCALGQSATFNVSATGTGISYVWKRGATVVGTNSDTYTVASVASGDIGNYTVTVSGTCSPAVTSNTVSLSVSTATVTIVTQPATQTLCIGDDLDLVVAATGPSLSYQWKKGTASLSDGGAVSGAMTSSLTISSVVSGDAGNYTCEITSACATPATSNVAAITVNTCTGVMAQQGNSFYVSPNPGAENFYLNAEGIPDGEAVVSVMNALGYEVWNGKVMISGGAMQQLLPVDLSSGMYTVMLSRGDQRYSTKMVVQK